MIIIMNIYHLLVSGCPFDELKHNIQISRVIPFIKLQHNTEAMVKNGKKLWKIRRGANFFASTGHKDNVAQPKTDR